MFEQIYRFSLQLLGRSCCPRVTLVCFKYPHYCSVWQLCEVFIWGLLLFKIWQE